MPATNTTVTASQIGCHDITLTGSTVDTVTFERYCPAVEITNRDTSLSIYFSVDGTTPTVGGANTYWVGPASSLEVPAPQVTSWDSATVVKIISSGAAHYDVQGAF